jgi:hypothetical protein
MNQLDNTALACQDGRIWSGRLGSLAAQQPAAMPATDFSTANLPIDPPTRFSAILLHFRQRRLRRQDARHTLRANEFVKVP